MKTELSKANTVILACTSMLVHLQAAQKKAGTDFQVTELDRRLHEDPAKMRQRIIETMKMLPDSTENILVSMGLCGGSWDRVDVNRRVVIPKVDDCITLLLHTDDAPHLNLKKSGHMYFLDCDDNEYSLLAMKERLCEKYGTKSGDALFNSWFASYTNADIIDTGVYDCHSEDYMAEARKNADLIGCRLEHVRGSNRILEKLVSGRWDEQFLVIEPGNTVKTQDFLENQKNKGGKQRS